MDWIRTVRAGVGSVILYQSGFREDISISVPTREMVGQGKVKRAG